jgi:hypothetical protein
MPDLPPSLRLTGEVTERAELLNGAMQLALDGATTEGGWAVELTLSWRLGRAGAVDLDEGDLTLDSSDAEIVAVLDDGTAELDPDTGTAEVNARFEVESVTGVSLDAGVLLTLSVVIGAEAWSGDLRTGTLED